MDSSQPSLRTLILTAAKQLSLEWQNDRIRLQLPSHPPMDRCYSGPFARALRRYIPEINVEEWDACCSDTGRQPMVYSMDKGLLSKYVHWARCLGVAEENLLFPPWLTPLTAPDAEAKGPAQPGPQPSYFSEPQARKLTEYQKRAICFGVSIRSGKLLLADDMGLGKRIQALGVAWQYRETFPLLILCPPAQRNVWQQEVAKWTPIPVTEVQEVLTETTVLETTARVVIVSYALLGKFEQLQSSDDIDFKVVIADKCHSIKHFDAQKSKVFLRIAPLAQRLILISSGPLVKKSAAELHPVFQSLDPYLGTEETFVQRYFGGKLGLAVGRRIDPRREQELDDYLFKVIGIRRKKAEVSSELPLRRQRIFLSKSGCSLSIGELKRMEAELFHRRFDSDSSGSKQARLSEMKRVSQLVMQTKRRSCVEYVTEISNHGGKMLLFAYHREMLDSLEAALKETLGASGYVRIDQHTPIHARENLVTCFEEDDGCHTALLSFTALPEGQTLPHVEAILFAELAWAPSILLQCEGRAHGIHGIDGIHGGLIQYLLLEDCQWDSHCYERLEEKLRREPLATREAAEPKEPAAKSSSIEPLQAAPSRSPSSQKEIHSFPLEKEAQEGLQHERRSDEMYQVVEHLHLGLNLKLQQCYTKDALEKKCKGNEQKLRKLHYFMKEAKKLHPVAAFKPRGGVGAQMVHPPKRQKLSDLERAST